ncbi:MAG TPA: hypothetical protein VD794_16340 [Flavisolibacter sp.]|nr:hypothetical protein [Flavisolibacter sp.]
MSDKNVKEYAIDDDGNTHEVRSVLGTKVRAAHTPGRVAIAVVLFLVAADFTRDNVSNPFIIISVALVLVGILRILVFNVTATEEEIERYNKSKSTHRNVHKTN